MYSDAIFKTKLEFGIGFFCGAIEVQASFRSPMVLLAVLYKFVYISSCT